MEYCGYKKISMIFMAFVYIMSIFKYIQRYANPADIPIQTQSISVFECGFRIAYRTVFLSVFEEALESYGCVSDMIYIWKTNKNSINVI